MSKKIDDEILDAVEILVKSYIKNASFNCMKYGNIIASLGDGKYTVKIDNVDITVPAKVGDSYSINDSVIICIPNNNKIKQFIFGKVKY